MEEKRQLTDKFMLRLPDGMRDLIKMHADANGRSMNAEIVACLAERFPSPTTEQYLTFLHLEIRHLRECVDHPECPEDVKVRCLEEIPKVREKLISVIDGKADPSTFTADMARIAKPTQR